MDIYNLGTLCDRLSYRYNELATEYADVNESVNIGEQRVVNIKEEIMIVSAVLSLTQEQVIGFIEETVAFALQYVYGDEYDFRIIYELKRNQPEVKLIPMKGDLEYDPKSSCGVGVVDVISFALRCAMWALQTPRSGPVLLLDEPFRHLSGDSANERVGLMVREMAQSLGIQVIIVSGKSGLKEFSDKVFLVTQENGISNVSTLQV